MKRSIVFLLALTLTVAACGGSEEEAPESNDPAAEEPSNGIDITMQDYAFAVDGEPTAGPLTLTFHNEGEEMHHGIIGRLTDGKTIEDLEKFLSGPQGPPPSWFDDTPLDMTLISPGHASGVTFEAQEGTYALICFMPGPDGKPHFSSGMAQTFEVAAADGVEPPEPDATVSMTEEGVEAPEGLSAGTSFIEVTNDGNTEMEAYVVRFEDGKGPDDVEAWFNEGQQGPVPATFFGGTHTFPAGESALLSFDLEPGDYQLVASYENASGVHDLPSDFTVGE